MGYPTHRCRHNTLQFQRVNNIAAGLVNYSYFTTNADCSLVLICPLLGTSYQEKGLLHKIVAEEFTPGAGEYTYREGFRSNFRM